SVVIAASPFNVVTSLAIRNNGRVMATGWWKILAWVTGRQCITIRLVTLAVLGFLASCVTKEKPPPGPEVAIGLGAEANRAPSRRSKDGGGESPAPRIAAKATPKIRTQAVGGRETSRETSSER